MTKARAAELAGYSLRNFTERIQPRIDKGSVSGQGGSLRFDARGVVKALASYIAEQSRPRPEDSDPLIGTTSGSDDPVLDEYRREATIEKRLKNAATRGELIDRIRLETALQPAFSAAAKAGEALVRRFGNDAGELWNEGIDAIRDAAKQALLTDEPADE